MRVVRADHRKEEKEKSMCKKVVYNLLNEWEW